MMGIASGRSMMESRSTDSVPDFFFPDSLFFNVSLSILKRNLTGMDRDGQDEEGEITNSVSKALIFHPAFFILSCLCCPSLLIFFLSIRPGFGLANPAVLA
jgi:hypothetical protein